MILFALFCVYLFYAEYEFYKSMNDVLALCFFASLFVPWKFVVLAKGNVKPLGGQIDVEPITGFGVCLRHVSREA
jgi:hypothetical protein